LTLSFFVPQWGIGEKVRRAMYTSFWDLQAAYFLIELSVNID
jgi:hypothetical protein